MADGFARPYPTYPAYTVKLAAMLILLLLTVGTANWAIDPLQVFRRSTWHSPHFSENQRYQVPGLARHYTEPIVIIGTSHMENMLPSLVAEMLGKPALNLAIAGSSLREQALALSLALETGKVERVLWGIDYSALTWGDILVEEWGEFPEYLYRFDPRLVSRYLLSMETLTDSATSLLGPSAITLDNRNTWWNRHTFSRDRVTSAWLEQTKELTPAFRKSISNKLDWNTFKHVLERRLFSTVRNHPQTRFDLILPPYSILNYVNDFRIHEQYFFQRLLMRQALREFASRQTNVVLWDFQSDPTISTNLDNYKDLEHYGLPINRHMLARMTSPLAPIEWDDRLPVLVKEQLQELCSNPTRSTLYCTEEVHCGQVHLEYWLKTGRSANQLITSTGLPCYR